MHVVFETFQADLVRIASRPPTQSYQVDIVGIDPLPSLFITGVKQDSDTVRTLLGPRAAARGTLHGRNVYR